MNNEPRCYLVTGGAGFIGSKLVSRLTSEGHRVIVLDDLSSGRQDAVPAGAELVVGDIRDHDLLSSLTGRSDGVFHLAACVSVTECIDNWASASLINLAGTIAVLLAAQDGGNIPVVYASSAAVYGSGQPLPTSEACLPRPISPYGADKLASEHHAAAMWQIKGLPSVGLRFFNVFGEGQQADSPYAGVISRFMADRLADDPYTFFGDGQQSRDFIHVDDIVTGLTLSMARLDAQPGCEVVNLCTGRQTSLLALADLIDLVSQRQPLARRFAASRGGDIQHSLGCPDLARDRLGFVADVGLADGLARLWASLAGRLSGSLAGSDREDPAQL